VKIGFIGAGAIAEALLGGILEKKIAAPADVFLSDHKEQRCQYLMDKYQVKAFVGAERFLPKVDVLFLAIKPQVAKMAIEEIYEQVSAKTIVVSVVAGLSTDVLEQYFVKQPVIRVMPNTPVSVGEGMSALALGKNATRNDGQIIENLFNAVGKALVVKESAMDAVTGLSGSGPGYAFVMIDALADAGVMAGLPRQAAITLAAQTLLGAAKMVLTTNEHPAVLRDKVTSPAGTTIAGIRVLEQSGVRAALIDAVQAAADKSKAMGKK
jgi:pyrroline-5-carboxylate reductase